MISNRLKWLIKIYELKLKIQLQKLSEKLIESACRRSLEFGYGTCDDKWGLNFDDDLLKFY